MLVLVWTTSAYKQKAGRCSLKGHTLSGLHPEIVLDTGASGFADQF